MYGLDPDIYSELVPETSPQELLDRLTPKIQSQEQSLADHRANIQETQEKVAQGEHKLQKYREAHGILSGHIGAQG